MKTIHNATRIVCLVICDNVKCSRSMFSIFQKKYDLASIYCMQHPKANEEYDEFFYTILFTY